MRRTHARRLALTWALCCAGMATGACGEGTGPGTLAQLRLRAVFAPGEEPAALGVAVSDIRVLVQRTSGSAAVVIDTTLPFETGATLSWILDLTNPPETVDVTARLSQGSSLRYAGSSRATLTEGIGSSSGSVHDVPVAFVGSPVGQVASVDITPDSAGLHAIGATFAFRAVARDASGAVLSNVPFVWSSADTTVAAVAAIAPDTGRATARGVGRTVIRAAAGDAVDSAVLTVVDDDGTGGSVVSIEVMPPTALLTALGSSQQFSAIARGANGKVLSGVSFAWSSANTGVASVDASGRATAHGQGTTSITASAGGLTASARLVVRQVVASIVVLPQSVTLALQDSVGFTAVARDANGHIVPGTVFAWSSSSPGIAAVHPVSGVATANDEGVVTVHATSGGVSGSATLRVVEVGQIVVTPSGEPRIHVGGTLQFTVQVLDQSGNVIPGVQIRWSSSDASVATVGATSGLATGLTEGVTVITARAGGASGQTFLVVEAPGPAP